MDLVGDRPAQLIKVGKKLKAGSVKNDTGGAFALGCETPSQVSAGMTGADVSCTTCRTLSPRMLGESLQLQCVGNVLRRDECLRPVAWFLSLWIAVETMVEDEVKTILGKVRSYSEPALTFATEQSNGDLLVGAAASARRIPISACAAPLFPEMPSLSSRRCASSIRRLRSTRASPLLLSRSLR